MAFKRTTLLLSVGALIGISYDVRSRIPAAYIESLKSFQSPPVETTQPKAWVRELGGDVTLFNYFESRVLVPGTKHSLWKTRWVEQLTAIDALRERVFFDADSLQLVRYEIEKIQLEEKGWFDVDHENRKVRFEYFKNNEWKQSEDSYNHELLIGALLPKFISAKKDILMKGDDVDLSLAVPFMRKVYSFTLRKDSKVQFQGQNLIKIKLSASNMLMRAVVKPLYFFYSPEEDQVKKIEGKVFLKKRIGSDPDKWDSFEAESLFINPKELGVESPNDS